MTNLSYPGWLKNGPHTRGPAIILALLLLGILGVIIGLSPFVEQSTDSLYREVVDGGVVSVEDTELPPVFSGAESTLSYRSDLSFEGKRNRSGSGTTVLEVRFTSGGGAASGSADVHCVWSTGDGDPTRDPAAVRVLMKDVDPSRLTYVELPVEASTVLVWATASNQLYRQNQLDDLRIVGAEWAGPDARVVRSVDLSPIPRDAYRLLSGAIVTSGSVGIPNGLRVQIKWRVGGGKIGRMLATIDEARSRYSVPIPNNADPRSILATGLLCSPFSNDILGWSGEDVDVELESGKQLLIELGGRDGQPESARKLRVGYRILVENNRFKRVHETVYQLGVTDELGFTRFSGLPAEGRLTIELMPQGSGGVSVRLARFDYERSDPAEMVRRIMVDPISDSARRIRVFGTLPETGIVTESAWGERVYAPNGVAEVWLVRPGNHDVPITHKLESTDGRWEFYGAGGEEVTVYLAGDLAHEYDPLSILIQPGEGDVGPLEFPRVRGGAVRFVARNGASCADGLHKLFIKPEGRPTQALGRIDFPSAPIVVSEGITVVFRTQFGSSMACILEESYSGKDLYGLQECAVLEPGLCTSVEMVIGSTPAEGDGTLLLIRKPSPASPRVALKLSLSKGRAHSRVRLPFGLYYFQYSSAEFKGFACGFVEVTDSVVGTGGVKVKWEPPKLAASPPIIKGGADITILALDGVSLIRWVPSSWRSFHLRGDRVGSPPRGGYRMNWSSANYQLTPGG